MARRPIPGTMTPRFRPMIRICIAAALLGTGPGLVLAQPAATLSEQRCVAGDARSVVGQPYSSELAEKARQAAGARDVRKIEPGGAYTTDLRADRLNVEVDTTGVVQGVNCG